MSQENVEIVRRAYEAFTARHDLPRELFDPNYVLDLGESAPDQGVLRGVEAALEALRGYAEMFDEFRVEIEQVIHVDEQRVVTAVRNSGGMRGSDSEVSNHFFHVWTVDEGKVVRLSVHTDKIRALEAAGLSE